MAIGVELGLLGVDFPLHAAGMIAIGQDLSLSDLLSQLLLSSSLRLRKLFLILLLNPPCNFSVGLELRLLFRTSPLLSILIVVLVDHPGLLLLYEVANSESLVSQLTNILKRFVLQQILGILPVRMQLGLVCLISLLDTLSVRHVVIDLCLLLLFSIIWVGHRLSLKVRLLPLMPEAFHSVLSLRLLAKGSYAALRSRLLHSSVVRHGLLHEFVAALVP